MKVKGGLGKVTTVYKSTILLCVLLTLDFLHFFYVKCQFSSVFVKFTLNVLSLKEHENQPKAFLTNTGSETCIAFGAHLFVTSRESVLLLVSV